MFLSYKPFELNTRAGNIINLSANVCFINVIFYSFQWPSSSVSDVAIIHCISVHAAHLGQIHQSVNNN